MYSINKSIEKADRTSCLKAQCLTGNFIYFAIMIKIFAWNFESDKTSLYFLHNSHFTRMSVIENELFLDFYISNWPNCIKRGYKPMPNQFEVQQLIA